MMRDKFHKWIEKEIETEAEALEKKAEEAAEEDQELPSLRMPEDSYGDLMKRIEEKKGKAPSAPRTGTFHIRRRALIALGLAAALLAALGLGASGERLFAPEVESQVEDGEYNVTIISGDEEIYKDVTEEEAYDEIEDRLGILALRLGYKPQGMELVNVYIDEDMGEAQMELCYQDFVLRIYENKQNSEAVFDAQIDGEIIDKIETFYYDEELYIWQIDRDGDGFSFATQLEQGNAYYHLVTNMEINEFEEIVRGIFFKNI